jgi:hypothetical protein
VLNERKDLDSMVSGKTVEKVFSRKNHEFLTIQFTDGTFVNIFNVADKVKDDECIDMKVDYRLTEFYQNKR